MIPAGQYIERKSIIHSLDPRTKILLLILFAGLVLFRADWQNHIIALIILTLATILSRVGIGRAIKILWLFRFFLMITFLIHLLFTPGEGGYDWKFFHLSFAGVHNGFLYSLRIGLLMWSAALFGWVTSPISLADALEKIFSFLKIFKIPPRDVSMVVLLAMRFIPTMMDDAQKIRWAQFARGGVIEGGIFRKTRQIVPLVVPLFISAFRRADKLALALELRGYNPYTPRTKIKDLNMRGIDVVFIMFFTLLLFFVIKFTG